MAEKTDGLHTSSTNPDITDQGGDTELTFSDLSEDERESLKRMFEESITADPASRSSLEVLTKDDEALSETQDEIYQKLVTQGYDSLTKPSQTLFTYNIPDKGESSTAEQEPQSKPLPEVDNRAQGVTDDSSLAHQQSHLSFDSFNSTLSISDGVSELSSSSMSLPMVKTKAIHDNLEVPDLSRYTRSSDAENTDEVWGQTLATFSPDPISLDNLETDLKIPVYDENFKGDQYDIIFKGLLGIGGEGYVQLGVQNSLHRHVAIKRISGNWRSSQQVNHLISEARLTGSLEHPNIIPIHMLAQTTEGEPLILMKRVEGQSWSKNLSELGPLWPKEQTDLFSKQMGIFLNVCRAVEYAHSRGVLHLDIKPDNVMVGEYGEVYLVDWGIAERVKDLDNLPSGKICGTPHFMPSEMTYEKKRATDRSDQAMLGASLHYVVMGSPRYTGKNILEVIAQAQMAAPLSYPRGVHRELAEILNRACAHAPSERFQSVTEFRQALEGYLQHRLSIELVLEGEVHLQRLLSDHRLRSKGHDDLMSQDQYRELALTCRLTFERALQIWSENWTAQIGLDHLYTVWADFEIAHGQVSVTETFIRRLISPPPHLTVALERGKQLQQSQDDATRRLQEIEDALNLRGASRQHQVSIILNGFVWAGIIGSIGYLNREGVITFTQEMNYELTSYAAGFTGACFIFMWRFFTDTLWRRKFTFAFLGYLALIYLNRPLSLHLRIPLEHSLVFDGFLLTLFNSQLAALIHPLMWIGTCVSAVATLGVILSPQWALESLAIGILCANLCLSSVMRVAIDEQLRLD